MRRRVTWSLAKPFVIILVIGLLLLVLSYVLRFYGHVAPGVAVNIIEVVGVALFTIGLTSPFSEFFQFQTMSDRMDLLRGAQESGVTRIFESRVDCLAFNEALEIAFDQADELLLAGISFPVFDQRPFPKRTGDKLYDPKIPIRFLLLNPDGNDAAERSEIEIGRTTPDHIRNTLRSLSLIMQDRASALGMQLCDLNGDQLKEAVARLNMKVHLYDFPPIAYLVITNKTLFCEQYHFGRLPSDRLGDCIGGRIPVLQFNTHSETYRRVNAHFEYVSTKKSSDITNTLAVGTKVGVGHGEVSSK